MRFGGTHCEAVDRQHVLRAGREGDDAVHLGAQHDVAAGRADRRPNFYSLLRARSRASIGAEDRHERDGECDFGPFRATDPVALHRFDALRPVQRYQGDAVIVGGGLAQGDVVTAGVQKLLPGQKVALMDASAASIECLGSVPVRPLQRPKLEAPQRSPSRSPVM